METKGDYNAVQSIMIGGILACIGEDTKAIRVLEIWDTDCVGWLYERDGGRGGQRPLPGYFTPPGRIVIAAQQDPFSMLYTILHELGHVLYGSSEEKADQYYKQRINDLADFLGIP
jgi:hypothetical protein